jgi:hypothetical protein
MNSIDQCVEKKNWFDTGTIEKKIAKGEKDKKSIIFE